MPTSTLSNKRADNDHPVNPVNLPAERAALGAVIEDDSLLRDVVDAGLHPSDFALSDHRSVFDAVMVLANQKKPIDYVLVAEQLGNQQTKYVLVASLIEGVIVEPDHVLHYVEIVRGRLACVES